MYETVRGKEYENKRGRKDREREVEITIVPI